MAFSQEVTLVANTQHTFNLDQPYNQAKIITDGTAEVWYTSDGSAAAVGSGGFIPAIGAESEVVVDWAVEEQEPGAAISNRVINVISTALPKVTVEAGIT